MSTKNTERKDAGKAGGLPPRTKRWTLKEWGEAFDGEEDPAPGLRVSRRVRPAGARTLAMRMYPADLGEVRVRPASGHTLAMRVGPHPFNKST